MDPIDLTAVDIAISKPSDASMNNHQEDEIDHASKSTTMADNTAIEKDASTGSEPVDVSISRSMDGSDDESRGVDGRIILDGETNEATTSGAGFEANSLSDSSESSGGNDLQNASEFNNVGDDVRSVDNMESESLRGLHQQKDGVESQNLHVQDQEDASIQLDGSSVVSDALQSNQHHSEQLTQDESTVTSQAMSKDDTDNTILANSTDTNNSKNDNQMNDTTNDANNKTIPNNTQSPPSNNTTKHEDDEEEPTPQILVDYASKVSGGQILEKSPSLKGTSNLLTGDMDRYAIAPCRDKKYVVIGLSEDILVKIVKLANYERYSSHVKDFQVLSSQEYPVQSDQWTDLGTYTALSKSGEQTFELKDAAWARYLKFKFLSHYGVEHYCTVSQIKVHGSTMLQGFHEQWIESEKMERGESDEDLGDGEVGSEEEEEEEQTRKDQAEEVNAAQAETESNAEPNIDRKLDGVSSGTTENDVAVDQTNNTDQDFVSSDQREECVKDSTTADVKDKEGHVEVGCKTTNASDADSSKKDMGNHSLSTKELPSDAATDQRGDTKQKVASGSTLPSTSEFVDDSKHVNESRGAISPSDDVPNASISHEETTYSNEKNMSIYAVADAVKAAMADASDAIKSVKEAVQAADAVTEIKKMIRTTIAVIDEDRKTEPELLEIANVTINGSNIPSSVIEAVDFQVIDLNVKEPDRMISGDNNSLPTNEDKPSSESALKEFRSSAGNATQVLKKNHVTDKENTTKTANRTSINNGAADEKSKSSSNTSTLKVEPAATHPRQRNTINSAAVDHFDKMLSRYPSASCIKNLDFQTFKAKSLVTNVAPGSAVGGAKMEPIFQKITSEIKSVQTTQHQYEQYISAIKTCYEHVFADMATDLDTMQSKFDARLTALEVMLLENRDVRPHRPLAFFGFPLPMPFPLTTISALFPFPVIFDSSEGVFMCIAIVFFVLMWRSKHKKNVTDTSAHNSDSHGSLSASPTAIDEVTPDQMPARKKCHFEDDISPLPIHAMKNGFHSNNLPNDISHDISCGESDCSTPSISLSEPIGATAGFGDPPSSATRKGNHRNRFRIRRRAKSDGAKTL
ncbi:hypothetical protein ACHAWX_005879 [Stephanocyclus meneghinianus]